MTGLFLKAMWRDLAMGAGLLCAAGALLLWPQACMQAVRDGLSLCSGLILPSLFPFFVLSSLVVELGLSRYLGKVLEPVMRPLFHLSGTCACALAVGMVGGYPTGARTAVSLYQSGQCTREEAQRLLAFCSNCGPAFILGAAGAGVFGSRHAGLVLYITHLCSCVLTGLLLRPRKLDAVPSHPAGQDSFHTVSFSSAFTRSVTGALTAVLNICAFILCFGVVLRCLTLSGILAAASSLLTALLAPIGLTAPLADAMLAGLFELSTGISSLGCPGGSSVKLSLAAFLLGWAGLCVHCQVLAFTAGSGLSMRYYWLGNLLQGVFSAALTPLVLRLTAPLPPVESCLSPLHPLSSLPGSLPVISVFCILAVRLLFSLFFPRRSKKSSRNAGRHAL